MEQKSLSKAKNLLVKTSTGSLKNARIIKRNSL